jgi:hypothetical protein
MGSRRQNNQGIAAGARYRVGEGLAALYSEAANREERSNG